MTRHASTTQRITTPFGAVYLHLLRAADNRLCGLNISTPGTMHGKELGEVLEDIVRVIGAELEGGS